MGKMKENPRKPLRENKKITVGRVEDLPVGRSATVELPKNGELALFNVKGKFYAIENFCPHKGVPLAESQVQGKIVECERHGWKFDLQTGECFEKEGCSIEAYEVIVEDDEIKIIV
ncbi:MAG: Rieske 2Fe-2S domain-containing protein [Pyrinomonadaceae bacterium]|nr:Rieske 2Fe-2S domain-containing protein [Pyrinomonadaceae bacterium]